MIITIVGGGSTFTPGIVKSIALRQKELEVEEVRLFDIDEERQYKVSLVVDWILKDMKSPIRLTVTTDKRTEYENSSFIFAQMRVGKYAMREKDEKIPLRHGCVGQETCGCGGLAYGLRTLFPMIQVIDDVEKYAAPDHWILNYSNPAAVVSEACRALRPHARIINICDMPIAILEMVGRCLDIPNFTDFDVNYFGLNHFGWFTDITYQGRDLKAEITEYVMKNKTLLPPDVLEKLKEHDRVGERHLNASWIHTWNNVYKVLQSNPEYLPNTYLQYYLLSKDVVEESNPEYTRANEVMDSREKDLFEGIDYYIKTGEVTAKAFYHGAHGNYIADLAMALKNDTKKKFIVIVQNNGAIENIAPDAMVEVPAYIGKNGPEVICQGPIGDYYKGLMEQQLASEKLLVAGGIEGSYEKVWKAFSMNKTVPSATVAKAILDEMIEANKEFWPELR